MSVAHELDGVTFPMAFDDYRAAGWARTFPLPARAKDPPPTGITGKDGQGPDDTLRREFRRCPIDSNLGIAMPQDLLGIDVDQYGTKRGADNLAAELALLEVELPPTRRSTSRGPDDPSGIRFYRVPPGLFWKYGPCDDVEFISWHQRYAVVWPSVHPEGRPYRWDDDDGPLDTVPLVGDDWPDLPWKCVAAWTRAEEEPADFKPAAPQHAERALWHPTVASKLSEYTNRNGGSRHETARAVAMALCRLEQFELTGATSALDDLGDRFIADVAPDRGHHVAAAEWGRLLSGGRVRAQSTASTSTYKPAIVVEHPDSAALAGTSGDAPSGVDPDTGETTTAVVPWVPILPPDFWEARPLLTHIRRAAHARQRSADAVLHTVLTRISAVVDHGLRIPPIVGSAKPLSYFVAVVAGSGGGKSTGNDIAVELVPAPNHVLDQVPPGSGEGLAELLFDIVEETDDHGKTIKVKRQVRHAAIVYIDEGQVLAELGNRKGATLLPRPLRTIWTGGPLGQANANRERFRVVPAGSYVFGISVGFQLEMAGALLADATAGTPQRFGWASAIDPSVNPGPWPGPLPWEPTDRHVAGDPIVYASEIEGEVRVDDLARTRGQITVDALDSHAGLYRLKVAALLAILDGRRNVTLDDWQLALIVRDTSNAVRTMVANTVAAVESRKEAATRDRLSGHAVHSDEAVHRRQVVDTARKIALKVWGRDEPWTVTEMRRDGVKRSPDMLADGIDHARAEGWIVEKREPSHTGSDKRVLSRGKTRPL